MSDKASIDVKMFWYTHIVIIPKFVTIITTVDKGGIINAAPYSLGTPFNVGKRNPQILLGMRGASHTCKNAIETGEFVVNFPSSTYLNDVMKTAQFMPKEENELEYTQFTTVASKKVSPPSIKECYQHLECRLHDTIELDFGQVHLIGDIVEIVVDKKLIDLKRHDRIKTVDPPIYLGDERRRYFHFGKIGEIEQCEFQLPEKRDRRKKIRTNMPWEEAAKKELPKLPIAVRDMVIELIENEAHRDGNAQVTYRYCKKLEEEYAPQDSDNLHY